MKIGTINQSVSPSVEYSSKGEGGLKSDVRKSIRVEGSNPPQSQEKANVADLDKAVEKLNKFLEDEHVHAVYEIHEKLKDVMIKIVNSDTNEVVLEIPSKKILDMVAEMLETVGILLDKKA